MFRSFIIFKMRRDWLESHLCASILEGPNEGSQGRAGGRALFLCETWTILVVLVEQLFLLTFFRQASWSNRYQQQQGLELEEKGILAISWQGGWWCAALKPQEENRFTRDGIKRRRCVCSSSRHSNGKIPAFDTKIFSPNSTVMQTKRLDMKKPCHVVWRLMSNSISRDG